MGRGGFTVPAYAASKGGVSQLTKALSNEWAGKGISVNAIAPGYVATEMNAALMAGRKQGKEYPGEDPGWEWGDTGRFQGTRLVPGKCSFSIRVGGMPSR